MRQISKEERDYMKKEGLTDSPATLYFIFGFIGLSIGLITWWVWSIFNA